MARRDVSDFVPQNARQFGFRIQIGHQAARDIDVAAGEGKGIDVGAVQHRESPLQIGSVAVLRQLLADCVHVALQSRVFQRGILPQYVLTRLRAQLQFLLFGHQDKILAARHGVAGAMRQQQCTQRDEGNPAKEGKVHDGVFPGMKPAHDTAPGAASGLNPLNAVNPRNEKSGLSRFLLQSLQLQLIYCNCVDCLLHAITLAEFLDAAGGVDDLLLAGIKRMAG